MFADAGRTLGTAVGNLVNLLNPKLVILAGEGTRTVDLFRDDFDPAWLRRELNSGLGRARSVRMTG